MATSPLTASRYPQSTASPNVSQDIQNAVTDLEKNAIGYFATTGARDTAFTNWVAAGNSMRDGLHCYVQGTGLQQYHGSTWVTVDRTLYRRITATNPGTLNGSSNLCAAQSIPASPLGTSVSYVIDVDAVSHLSSVPSGLGGKLEIFFDGVLQEGDVFTNAGTLGGCQYTLRSRAALTVADNLTHTVTAVVTSLAGTITVDTTYSRLILMVRPYVAF